MCLSDKRILQKTWNSDDEFGLSKISKVGFGDLPRTWGLCFDVWLVRYLSCSCNVVTRYADMSQGYHVADPLHAAAWGKVPVAVLGERRAYVQCPCRPRQQFRPQQLLDSFRVSFGVLHSFDVFCSDFEAFSAILAEVGVLNAIFWHDRAKR